MLFVQASASYTKNVSISWVQSQSFGAIITERSICEHSLETLGSESMPMHAPFILNVSSSMRDHDRRHFFGVAVMFVSCAVGGAVLPGNSKKVLIELARSYLKKNTRRKNRRGSE